MLSVVLTKGGLVGVGDWYNHQSWISDDGTSWDRAFRVESDMAVGSMTDVVVAEAGLVAIGTAYTQGEKRLAVWSSLDGSDWFLDASESTVFGNGWLRAIAVRGDRLVAVGWVWADDASDNIQPAVWTAELDN